MRRDNIMDIIAKNIQEYSVQEGEYPVSAHLEHYAIIRTA